MQIYIGIWIIMLLLKPICNMNLKLSKKTVSGMQIYLIITCMLIWIITGLRSPQVGTDTGAYTRDFLRIINASFYDSFFLFTNNPPCFVLFCKAVGIIWPTIQGYIFFSSGIVALLCYFFIRKSSCNYSLSVFLFYTIGFAFYSMNGCRQTIAILLCGLALLEWHKSLSNKIGWILFFVALGTHLTSIIMLIGWVAIWVRQKMKKVTFFYIAILFSFFAVLIYPVIGNFVGIISYLFPHYSIYLTGNASVQWFGGSGQGRISVLYLIILLFTIWGFYFRKKRMLGNEEPNEIFGILVIFGMIFGILNSKNQIVNRLVWFFILYFIPLEPALLKSESNKYNRFILEIIIYVGFSLYMLMMLVENQNGIVPYSFGMI